MAKHGENIYKRKDGRWEARAIKGCDGQGKPLYTYFYGRTYKEAKEKMFSALSSDNDGEATGGDAVRFENVLNAWLDSKRVGAKESTYVKYFNTINNHIKPSLGHFALTAITSTVLNSFVAEKLAAGNRETESGLSEKTVKYIITLIKSVLRFAKDEGLVSEAVKINLTMPREKPKEMRVLTKDEQAALEKHLCSKMDGSKLGILVCLYTGLRVGEICALTWGDISLGAKTLTVSRTMQRLQTLDDAAPARTKVSVAEPKSECSTRTIPLPDCLVDKLKKLRRVCPDAYILTGKTTRRIEPRTYQNHFKAYVDGCGIENANFHATRHTFATRCVEAGFDVKTLSEILGHSSVTVTLDRYVHPTLDMKRKSMDKLDFLH